MSRYNIKGKFSYLNNEIIDLSAIRGNPNQIAQELIKKHELKVDPSNFRKYVKMVMTKSKPVDEFDWREVLEPITTLQNVFKRTSKSTTRPKIKVDTDVPICVVFLADLHACSWSTDHSAFQRITDELIKTPNLYAIIGGDLLQMAIKLRGVAEVADNALPPKWQMAFLDSWLKETYHKVLFSIWDNHSVMREEKAVGFSTYAHIFQNYTMYSPGITHADLTVGDQTYNIAASHFFRGNSIYNPCHAQMRYGKFKGQDREIIFAGHTHQPCYIRYMEDGKIKLAVNCGSLQHSGYDGRFYSITNNPIFPCVVFHPDQHVATPYYSVGEWLASTKKKL